jgi:hypothetical protein
VIAEAAAVRVMGQDVDRTVVVHEPVEDTLAPRQLEEAGDPASCCNLL